MWPLLSFLGLLGTLVATGLPVPAGAQPVGSEFRVNTYTTGHQLTRTRGGHMVASDANGNFVVVWHGVGQGDKQGIFGQRYDDAGNALGAEFRVNSFTPFSERYASVAAGADGDFVVVWSAVDYENSSSDIFGQRYDGSGNAVGSEFRVSQSNGSGPPSVAAAADGAFVVVWTAYRGFQNPADVFGRRYDSAGQALGNEFRVNFVHD